MDQIVLFALLGLGSGALIAGIAVGLVLTYRGSGIINLATGAVAMVGAYAFWAFRTGEFGPTFNAPVSFAFTVVVALLVGVLTELLVFRPLRTASPLAKLAGSLGVLLVLQAAILLAFGSNSQVEPSILPTNTVTLFGIIMPINRFVLAGLVVAMSAVLAALYHWSRFGLATRAASENEISGMLVGLSPNALSMTNTLLASLVAGVLGVLVAPVSVLDTVSLPLQVVPALAAALFARFTSIWIACLAGLGIGAAENLLYYASTQSWFPKDDGVPFPGVRELLVFLLILVAMFLRGASLPRRGDLVEQRLPAVPRPRRLGPYALLALVVVGGALIVFPFSWRQALVATVIATVLMLSLVVITGFVGQISVVQLALAGISGLVMSHLATDAGIGFPLAPLVGALVATVLGLLIAVSALRIRGVYLAVSTLAAAVAIERFWFGNGVLGVGDSGAPVGQPHLFGLNLGNAAGFKGLDGKLPSPMLGLTMLPVAILLCLFVANLRRTTLGQRMLAVRSNERAAAAVGISVRNVKLTAFAFSSFIAGIAGAMYAYNFGSVSATRYGALPALGVIAFAYVGGITMVSGAIIGALISTEALFPHAFESWFGLSGTWLLLFGGVSLIFNLIFYPDGVAGATYQKRELKKRLLAAGVVQPSRAQTVLTRLRSGRASPAEGDPTAPVIDP